MEEIRQDLELLTVEDLVVGIYQQKFLKEPSKTWVRSLLDVAMWDYSSNTRYLILQFTDSFLNYILRK